MKFLAFAFVLCFAWRAPAQVTSPNGSYGVLLNHWPDSNQPASAFLGVLNFDGAGNVSGSYTVLTMKQQLVSGTLTGTYSGKTDGTNTVNLTLDAGGTITAAVAVTDAGTGLQIMVTGGSSIDPAGQVITGSGRIQSAQGTMPAGSYGYLLNQRPNATNSAIGSFGVLNLDGAGNVIGSYTIIGTDVGPAAISGAFKGTYSTNPDGTGSLTVNLDLGITATLAIVVIDGGAGIQLLQTAESDGLSTVISGIARRQ